MRNTLNYSSHVDVTVDVHNSVSVSLHDLFIIII